MLLSNKEPLLLSSCVGKQYNTTASSAVAFTIAAPVHAKEATARAFPIIKSMTPPPIIVAVADYSSVAVHWFDSIRTPAPQQHFLLYYISFGDLLHSLGGKPRNREGQEQNNVIGNYSRNQQHAHYLSNALAPLSVATSINTHRHDRQPLQGGRKAHVVWKQINPMHGRVGYSFSNAWNLSMSFSGDERAGPFFVQLVFVFGVVYRTPRALIELFDLIQKQERFAAAVIPVGFLSFFFLCHLSLMVNDNDYLIMHSGSLTWKVLTMCRLQRRMIMKPSRPAQFLSFWRVF